MILLDTHVFIWWLTDPAKLSNIAGKSVKEATEQNAVFVSSISVWEIALLIKKERLILTVDVADWIKQTEQLPFLSFLPVDNSVAVKSVNLPGPFHDDLADRMIVATSLITGFPLVTSDVKIRNCENVKTIW